MGFFDKIPWGILIIACLSLGLAPFFPPHIWEKLVMLKNGTLAQPIDWFDLLYHAVPWALLLIKAAVSARGE